ncbi:MAG: MBOAT family protein [Nitrospirae bacterium]|nr:MBOAT family protein [Nitrospirota bacterium]
MVFSSLTFLFLFLPAALGAYYLATRRYRNLVLLLFSYLFYLWGSGEFLLILILSTLVDYALGLCIDRRVYGFTRGWVFASVAFNLALLAYFKYANFFVAEFNGGLGAFGISPVSWTAVILPIGISFFTFQKITYVVDIYRHQRGAFTRFVDFALYVALFPQLIAGPIVRFHEISEQIRSRRETLDDFHQGVLRFCWGIGKKVVLANPCGEIADAVFALGGGSLDTQIAWLGIFAYTLQIYLDFSAYSDMAIGLGRMFGFRFPENFNRPYSSVSITDFWRRWHMTLSRFFRDYVYIPMGGNRLGAQRTYFNLMTVFILCGFWHGANWTFLIWGAYHGGLLLMERVADQRDTAGEGGMIFLRRFLTLILVMIGWVFFRSADPGQALTFLSAMFSPLDLPAPVEPIAAFNGRNFFFLALASVVFFLPRDFSVGWLMESGSLPSVAAVRGVVLAALVLYSVALLASGSFNPFLYFQF